MGRRLAIGALGWALALVACGDDGVVEHPCLSVRLESPPSVDAELASLGGLDFDAFVDQSHGALLRRDPEALSELGLSARFGADDSQLTSIAATYEAETARLATEILTRLLVFDRAALTAAEQRTYDVYRWNLEEMERQHAYADYVYPVVSLVSGVQSSLLLFLEDLHPVTTAAQAEGFVNRVCQSDTKITELIAGLDRREAAGLVAPQQTLDRALYGITWVASTGPTDLPLYQKFAAKVDALASLTRAERDRLKARARAAAEEALIPAYARLRDRVLALRQVAPVAIGVDELPGGDAFYAAALRRYTTTTLDAAAIAALGNSELERIHAEMRTRFDALGYPTGESLSTSYDRVIVDGGTLSGPDVAAGYEALLEAANARLPEAFVLLPVATCAVVPIAGGGFYVGPSIDGTRPGAFYAPVSGTRPRYGMPTLAYHEMVPGHHLQIALALEGDAPLMRKVTQALGFSEGWALYAERLAAELGWYTDDPYGDLGRLQMEAFRAARLVVDTGIHAFGWEYDAAVSFTRDATGFDPSVISIEGEVSRYVAWPGQATAYMVGMLEIARLRAEAQAALGDRFDLAEFHAAILQGGAMPLEVLADVVADYVAQAP